MNILITGTTNGIGLATAEALYREDHNLILVNRNAERSEKLKKRMEEDIGSTGWISCYQADYSDLETVAGVCRQLNADYSSIDVLINNAGLFCDSHHETAQGLEMTLGVNYAATVLFTNGIIPLLQASKRGRVITVASRAALFGKIRKKTFFTPKHPHGFPAYSASKLAVVLWMRRLAEEQRGLDVITVHPGEVASNIWKGESFFMKMMSPIVKKRYQTIEQGAETSIHLSLAADVSAFTGCFIEKRDGIIAYNKKCSNKSTSDWLSDRTKEFLEL